MVLCMNRPMKRSGSSVQQFRKRLPADIVKLAKGKRATVLLPPETIGGAALVVSFTIGADVRFSLQTRDPSLAKRRNAAVSEQLEELFVRYRSGPPAEQPLTKKQIVALAGETYRLFAETFEDNPVLPADQWRAMERNQREDLAWEGPIRWDLRIPSKSDTPTHREAARVAERNEALQRRYGGTVDAILMKHGLTVDAPTRLAIVLEAAKVAPEASAKLARNADGDYAPDEYARRFPDLSVLAKSREAGPNLVASNLRLPALFEQWQKHPEQVGIAQSTIASYRKTLGKLADFLGHDDAARVSREDVERFADRRRTEVSLKTVNDSDLVALKSVFGWAVKRRLLAGPNPAERVRLKERKRPTPRGDKGFTDAEAKALLKHALNCLPKAGKGRKMASAKRWVPWLMAYMGVRVGEAAQLRKQDVREHGGIQCAFIDYEAGTTKTKSTWPIPLHPHLIELGFLDFVRAAPDGHLFLTARPERYRANAPETRTKDPRGILGPLQGVKNRLSEFTREVVSRQTVAPNHGWRHRFKAIGRAAGIETVVLDAFQDHAARTISDSYGDPFPAMVKALDSIPRYSGVAELERRKSGRRIERWLIRQGRRLLRVLLMEVRRKWTVSSSHS